MFDLGWSEFLVIGAVAVIVVGPDEMPRVVRSIIGAVRKMREMAGDFQSSMEDIANDADVREIKKQILDSEAEVQAMLSEQTAEIDSLDNMLAENPTAKKTVTKNPTAKKTVTKSSTAKKTVTKSSTAKKTATKSVEKNRVL